MIRGLTRRSLLGAAGGSLAALARAPRALAPPPSPRLRVSDTGPPRARRRRAARAGPRAARPAGRTVRLDGSADLLALGWREPPLARPELRFRTSDGSWSRWVCAAPAGHEDYSGAAAGSGAHSAPPVVGEPLWTGGTNLIQLRSAHTVRGARLYAVDVSGGAGAARLAARAPRPPTPPRRRWPRPARRRAGQPPIIARQFWAQGHCPPSQAPSYASVELGFVHHTDSPNGYSRGEVPAMLRAIYVFHRRVRGWHDIGYNFALDRFGRIFEARAGGIDEAVVGAHAGGYNTCSTGVAVLGTYASRPISLAARSWLEQLLAWKLSLHGVGALGRVVVTVDPAGAAYSRYPAGSEVSLPRIAGHRDADSTDCPGDALYAELPAIRARAHALAGTPVQATITTWEGGLLGTLTLLDGTPLRGPAAHAPGALAEPPRRTGGREPAWPRW